MRWLLRCCCCCRCWSAGAEDKATALDDSSSLIQDGHVSALDTTAGPEVHAFYVPRRHSSFQPSAFSPISVQPGRSHSDSCSSSDEEGVPEQRGRCWSTVAATSATDLSAFIANRKELNSVPNSSRPPTLVSDSTCGRFLFDRHILGEIAESEQDETSSRASPKSDAEVYGNLTFTTFYDDQEQRLTVFLKRATDLPKKGEELYGTFVKMNLTSASKNFRMSRAVKKTLSPIYNEEHVFQTNRSKWKSTQATVYLRLSVFDCDRQGRYDAIGHALLPLDRIGQSEQEHCLPLTPMSQPVKNLGQILVGLLYSATQSRLAVHVIKARHLRLDPDVHKRHLRPLHKDVLDTFCKVTLTCGGQKVKTCRSRSATGSDPFFDYRANFVVPPQYLRDTSTIVSVVVRSTLGQGVTLGRASPLGPYVETSDGVATHWGRMVQEGRSIVQWRNIYL